MSNLLYLRKPGESGFTTRTARDNWRQNSPLPPSNEKSSSISDKCCLLCHLREMVGSFRWLAGESITRDEAALLLMRGHL
jgi:hypothetical protein